MIKDIKPNLFFENFKDMNLIPMEKFIDIYRNRLENYNSLKKSLKLLNLLNKFQNHMTKNIEIVSKASEILNTILLQIRFNFLLKEKEYKIKELEITEEYEKTSDIIAISDLLEKLNKSLDENKKKLKYLKEDYLPQKNQIDQISNTIKNYKQKIQHLTTRKKKFFSEINRITREMSGNHKKKERLTLIPEIDSNLSNAQKIRALQKKAKKIQNVIRELKQKVEETNLTLKELNPVYEIYKKDYIKLKNIITNDQQKVTELELELKNNILGKKTDSHRKFNGIDLKSVRTREVVMEDLDKINNELDTISMPDYLVDLRNPRDLSIIKEKLRDLSEYLDKNQSEIKISKDKKEIEQVFESFQKFEILIDELETLINKFLSEIKLKSTFRILVSEDHKYFSIKIGFTRNNKEKVTFDNLTTPEKVFFIIIYYISVELQVGIHNIVFCNLFIPNRYNKAGSIFRTIRKIVPLFKSEKKLSRYNLIFILSNLEMKKEIKFVKTITIQEKS